MKIKMKKKIQFRMKKKEKTQYPILPQELVNEILLRLPVKSLIRFKSVCRSWFSLISNPQFARSHFDLGFSRTHRLVLLPESALRILSVDFNARSICDDSATAAVRLHFLPPGDDPCVKFLGSCRGFLLVDSFSDIYIWNPCTCVYREVPESLFFSSLFGFGYDPSTDDYLVLAFSDETTGVQIFSCRANTWKELEDNALPNIVVGSECEYLNDAIHWIAAYRDSELMVILVFDLIDRVFSEISMPNDFDYSLDDDDVFIRLRVFGEYLSICASGYENIDGICLSIWTMKEYKVQSSWTKSHIVVSASVIPTKLLSPICLTNTGDIIGMDLYTEVVKFNGKGEVLERFDHGYHPWDCDCCDPLECNVIMYTESLLSLPGNPQKQDYSI